ncbi:MAG: MATE family efflux transporter [Pontibacterium sp.]
MSSLWFDKPTHQRVWALAWPMILSNLSVPLLGLVDTAVIGHLPSSHYLAAVAAGSVFFTTLYWAFGFLRMGTTGMVSQAVGREDNGQNRFLLAQSLILAAFIGGFIWLVSGPLIHWGLPLLASQESIGEEAFRYAEIRIYGAPAVLCNYALLGWFLGNQNSRIPLLLLLSSNLLNMLLDVIAVYGLNMTSDGVALASVIAEYGSCALGLTLAWRLQKQLKQTTPSQQAAPQWQLLAKLSGYVHLISVNRYLFIRTLAILFSIAFFTRQGSLQGPDMMAANAVLLNFLLLISNGLDGFAHATEALSGKAYGSKKQRDFYQVIAASLLWSLATALLLSGIFLVAGEWIIAGLTGIDTVRTLANEYLIWVIFLPLVGVWSFLIDGIFVGTTQAKAMQNTMLFSVFLVFLPLWWFTQGLGNQGLWLAFIAMFVSRGLTGLWVFWRLCQTDGGYYVHFAQGRSQP